MGWYSVVRIGVAVDREGIFKSGIATGNPMACLIHRPRQHLRYRKVRWLLRASAAG